MPTVHEKVEAMSNAELLAHLEETQPTPAVLELIKRVRVESEPEPTKRCEWCFGAGKTILVESALSAWRIVLVSDPRFQGSTLIAGPSGRVQNCETKCPLTVVL